MNTTENSSTADRTTPARHHRIVIVGGGTAGITTAARLCKALDEPDVAVIEPATEHYYQPFWTLVGAGVVSKETSRRSEESVMPDKVTWIRDRVVALQPEDNRVLLARGEQVGYEYLIVASGLECDWDGVEGLRDALGHDGVCSNYAYDQCDRTWEQLQAFKGGNALFTMPVPPIKCAGAPQKIMYLADDHFRKTGVRDRTTITYLAGTPGIFSVKPFAETLNAVIARKGIETRFKHRLLALDTTTKTASFEQIESGDQVDMPYDFIHVTPPQRAPAFLAQSPLANEAGWCNVDKYTMRSPWFLNVFSLGDASSLPTSKTGAAIRKQAPVLVHNLLTLIDGGGEDAFWRYDGYASCPLTTGYGKLVLAEFDYDLNAAPSFPFDTTKERRSMWHFKRRGLPLLYWQGMMKGRA